ncbi:MAG: T9SS type A sorting domain-containing protein [bacterium]|nr:T9SS type A sorting domain-containing protein [bacterium]
MTKHFLPLAIGLAFFSYTNAQITIDRSHIIVSGKVLVQATDTNRSFIRKSGIGETWDFSNLKSNSIENIRFGNADWYPGHQNFPNANLASISSTDDSSYTYLSIDNTKLSVEGSYATIEGVEEIANNKQTIITFPSTYQTNFAESILVPFDQYYLGQDIDSTGPYPYIDSIRLKLEFNTTSNMDGWGVVVTPLGTFNTLLQTVRNINRMRFEMKISGIWVGLPKALIQPLNIGNFPSDTSYQHLFWTKDASVGFPLISYSYGPKDTVTSEIQWLKTKPQQSNLTATQTAFSARAYPNPFQNNITISLPANVVARITIYDINGKNIIDQTVLNNEVVDLSNLSRGIYTGKIIDQSNGSVLQTQKLIKY